MGKATILFHIALVLLQILLLRREFHPVQLLQIVAGVVFGYFTTFCNYLVTFLPVADLIVVRVAMIFVSALFVAWGIFLYLPTNLIPLAGEGAMHAVSRVTGVDFSKIKIGFDCTMVAISLTTCLFVIRGLGSVGIGTILAAVLVGTVHGAITKRFGALKDWLLHLDC